MTQQGTHGQRELLLSINVICNIDENDPEHEQQMGHPMAQIG